MLYCHSITFSNIQNVYIYAILRSIYNRLLRYLDISADSILKHLRL